MDVGEDQDQILKDHSAAGVVSRWIKEIDTVLNSEAQRMFEHAGERIVKNYKNYESLRGYGYDKLDSNRVMYNVLWANVQILYPMAFARMPEPVVERWYKDSDPIGLQASDIAECCTSFQLKTQQDRFMYAVGAAVRDRLLPGRGQVWIRFAVEMEDLLDDQGQPVIGKDGEPIQRAKRNSERAVIDPLMWMDYLESTARNQYEIKWRAKRVYMTREELEERFGEEIGSKVSLQNFKEGVDRRNKLGEDEQFLKQAEVFEILDEVKKQVVWISRGYKKGPLDVKNNPLNISDFWCCPIPLLATTTSDSTYPTPDYVIYERLADEADWATRRISSVFECIRVVGATSKAYNNDIKEMLKLSDGQLWPIANWAKLIEDKGFAGIIDWMPFDAAVAAIGPMTAYRDDILQKIDAITGVPDFAHGVTDPNESVASIQKRAQFTQPKIVVMQQDVQRFCREIVRKVAEIIFEPGLFSDETIALMYGLEQRPPQDQQTFPQALALLRDDRLRTFRVDIETDSTIAADEAENQAKWAQYMQGVQGIFSNVEAVQQFRPELMRPMLESALGAIRSLRTGRNVEGAWEKAMQDIEDADEAAKANPQPPPPDPSLQIAQMRSQDEQQKLQATMQTEQGKLQLQAQKDQGEMQYKFADLDRQRAKDQADYELGAQKVQVEGAKVMNQAQLDKIASDLEAFQAQYQALIEGKLVELKTLQTHAQIAESASEERRLGIQAAADLIDAKDDKALRVDQHLHNKQIDHANVQTDLIHAETQKIKVKNDAKKIGKPTIKKS